MLSRSEDQFTESKITSPLMKKCYFVTLIISSFALFLIFLKAWMNTCETGILHGLYAHLDGATFAWYAKAFIKWAGPFDTLVLNPFQGMGSEFVLYSPWWNPGALALCLPFDIYTTYIISYSIYWIEIYASLFFLARTIGLSKVESMLVSQVFVLAFFPPFADLFSKLSYLSAPFFAHLMAMANVMVILYIKLGENGWIRNFIFIALILFCSFIFFMSGSFMVMVFAPVYGLICLGLTFDHFNKQSILWKTTGIILILSALYILGIPNFFLNAADYFVRGLLNQSTTNLSFCLPSSWVGRVSYPSETYGFYLLNIFFCKDSGLIGYFFVISFLGSIVSLFWPHKRYRWLACSFIFLACVPNLIVYLSGIGALKGRIIGLTTGYFNIAVWSFFSIFFILALSFVGNGFLKFSDYFLLKCSPRANKKITPLGKQTISLLMLSIIPLVAFFYLPPKSPVQNKTITPSVEYLRKHISLQPGERFRGSSVSYFLAEDSPLRKLLALHPLTYEYSFIPLDYLTRYYGNRHMYTDLWEADIPTFEQYWQTINLPSFLFVENLLGTASRVGDKGFEMAPIGYHQTVLLRVFNLDLRILRALGVRFIITDSVLSQAGVVKILEQNPTNINQVISLNVCLEARKIYERLTTAEEFKRMSTTEGALSYVKSETFINEFKKVLDQTFNSDFTKEKDTLIAALHILNHVPKMSFDFLQGFKTYFYHIYLSSNTIPPTLYLYEITNPNLATFSPTQPIRLYSVKEMLAQMKKPDFLFEKSVIVQDDVPPNLVPAKNSTMRFKRNKVRVQAESDNWSLLLLPLQYSHCLQLSPTTSDLASKDVRLIRANLIQSALVFKGKIDVHLRPKSAFDKCRQEDIIEIKKFMNNN